jgi:hypothetical protein
MAAPDVQKAGAACTSAWINKNLKLNDIVAVGTHNSYKQAIAPAWLRMIRMGSSKDARAMDYALPPISTQIDVGARALEFDIVNDPQGGAYASPAGAKMSGETLPDNYAAAMSAPGFKVMHIQDVDYHSSCLTLTDCLTIVRDWSRAHPDHAPILIAIQTRDDDVDVPGAVPPVKFDAAAFDMLDAKILSVFDRNELITPDQVRGKFPDLRSAVLANHWPTLAEARGKIFFALTTPAEQEHALLYLGKGPVLLQGRVMFVMAEESSPAASIIRADDPIEDKDRIAADVKAGFIVRTRADAQTEEARSNDTKRRDAALASGAQYVVTDYIEADKRFGDYQVRMPAGIVALCNPLRTAARCDGGNVEPAGPLLTASH